MFAAFGGFWGFVLFCIIMEYSTHLEKERARNNCEVVISDQIDHSQRFE